MTSSGRAVRPGRIERCQLPSWIQDAPQHAHEACGFEFRTTVTVADSQTGQRTKTTPFPGRAGLYPGHPSRTNRADNPVKAHTDDQGFWRTGGLGSARVDRADHPVAEAGRRLPRP